MKDSRSYLLGNRRISRAIAERKNRAVFSKEEKDLSDLNKKIKEIESQLNSFGESQKCSKMKIENLLSEIKTEMEIIASGEQWLKQRYDKKNIEQAVIARELMKVKWEALERKSKETEKDTDILECLICGNKSQRKNLETKTANCIFNGGQLVRYVCSCCGAIFGPSKFADLSQQEKDEDYYIHYLGFSEGDSTEKELRAFRMLNPKKEGIYLNYGCGNWSKSLQLLHEEGYTVYGYEPYAQLDIENPYIITEKAVLERIRFDGIYSNDVIEHFVNPIEEFNFMKTLLRDSESKMSHSTACYIYKHEETRFHTYFFTGDSLKYLCNRTGLESCDYINDVEENDFICHVFRTKDFQMDYLPMMYTMGKTERTSSSLILYENSTLYGPYFTCSPGKITLFVDLKLLGITNVEGKITVNAGVKIIKRVMLTSGINSIDFEVGKGDNMFEFVVSTKEQGRIEIKSIVQR